MPRHKPYKQLISDSEQQKMEMNPNDSDTSSATPNTGGPTNEGDSMQDQHDVKSFAVVKYSAVQSPAPFSELQCNTNLNQPPANWLRSTPVWQGLKGNWVPGNRNSTMFSSFHMANDYPDCVGEVDVISDAENIKNLLKIPYNSAPVSMIVHRIGNTLLLDEFDFHRYLIREEEDQWKWLRKFLVDHVLKSMRERQFSQFPRERKSRDHLLNKSMFSKFLYYSVPQNAAAPQIESNSQQPSTEADMEPPSLYSASSSVPPSIQINHTIEDADSSDGVEVVQLEHQVESELAALVEQNKTDDNHLITTVPEPPCISESIGPNAGFQRNVVWTFEDIQMLVGTDMPIFGDGNHPCITLKLSDMDRPINVLTGLDYWLDNLMCNVPEVVMCFHQNGIVKKYDVFKTEDIPKMENCNFSPGVVKDVAQNILSFLKSKAAKTGHTYWLFKAKDSDVVKLYDLTTELVGSQSENPFTVPVAMLLYNVASNLKKLHKGKKKKEIICTLLKNCLKLLDKERYSQVYSYALFLLSDLYIPTGINPTSPNFADGTTDDDDKDSLLGEERGDEEDEEPNSSPSTSSQFIPSPSMNIKALCYPNAWIYNPQKSREKDRISNMSTEERCKEALQHLAEGLSSLDNSLQQKTNSPKKGANEKQHPEEKQRMAKPLQAIPLRYSSLSEPAENEQNQQSKTGNGTGELTVTSSSGNLPPDSWQCCYKILLLEKSCVTSLMMANFSVTANKLGRAMRYIKLALLCYDGVRTLRQQVTREHQAGLLSCILTLAGDTHLSLVHSRIDMNSCREDFNHWPVCDNDICNSVYLHLTGDHEYEWVSELSSDQERALRLSQRCYEAAQEGSLDPTTLKKKLGIIYNEVATLILRQATELCKTNETSVKIKELADMSYDLLTKGLRAFTETEDSRNLVIVYLNLGQAMRIQALYVGRKGEVDPTEEKFYRRAAGYYESARRVLGTKSSNPDMWADVEWNLSTTLFTLATQLQDFPPLTKKAHQQVEQDISDLMKRTLKICDVTTPGRYQLLYQFRVALIHHKLGSLYHNSYRNQYAMSEQRKKKLPTEALSHYKQAMDMYANFEMMSDFLYVQMEAVELCEYMCQELSGFVSKQKALLSALRYAMAIEEPLTTFLDSHVASTPANQSIDNKNGKDKTNRDKVQEEEDVNPEEDTTEKEENSLREKRTDLLLTRISHVLELLRNLYSGRKSGKNEGVNKSVVEVLDRMRRVLESPVNSSGGSVALLKILNKIKPHYKNLESMTSSAR